MTRHRKRAAQHPHEPRPSVHGPARGARTSAPGARRWPPTAIIAACALAALAMLTLWWARRPAARYAHLSNAAISDSIGAAEAARDGQRALYWTQLLAARDPLNPMGRLTLALEWHNAAWNAGAADRLRPATRTSLERIAMEREALALLDSADVRARNPEEVARIAHWRGQVYENLGLPVDGLGAYVAALREAPGFALSAPRATFLLVHLRDPLAPDTATSRPRVR